jgi:hypothetical protein
VQLLHSLARTHASFDDPNLVSHAGLVLVMALAQRAGLADLVAGTHGHDFQHGPVSLLGHAQLPQHERSVKHQAELMCQASSGTAQVA